MLFHKKEKKNSNIDKLSNFLLQKVSRDVIEENTKTEYSVDFLNLPVPDSPQAIRAPIGTDWSSHRLELP